MTALCHNALDRTMTEWEALVAKMGAAVAEMLEPMSIERIAP